MRGVNTSAAVRVSGFPSTYTARATSKAIMGAKTGVSRHHDAASVCTWRAPIVEFLILHERGTMCGGKGERGLADEYEGCTGGGGRGKIVQRR